MLIELQTGNEQRYARKHIDKKIRDAITANEDTMNKHAHGVELVRTYIETEYAYESKNKRVQQLVNMDLDELVLDVFVGIAYVQRPELFTSVSAQLASRVMMSDKTESIQTIAEILAVLCNTDAFDINKASRGASLMLISRIELPDELLEFIAHSEYLPPMVCPPKTLRSNYDSGLLTVNDSLILGSGNHHDGDICIDVLNIVNQVPLSLDLEFLSTVEETPKELTIEDIKEEAMKRGRILSDADAKERLAKAIENWDNFKEQSYHFYHLMAQQGNRFYLLNKYDKRGRMYAQGYHISTQGAAFKIAMIELADAEIVEGVPPECQI
jgi:hypothetical protein